MADTHVTITGNLTDDPDLRFTPNGHPVANFRLAVAHLSEGPTSSAWTSTTVRRSPSGVSQERARS